MYLRLRWRRRELARDDPETFADRRAHIGVDHGSIIGHSICERYVYDHVACGRGFVFEQPSTSRLHQPVHEVAYDFRQRRHSDRRRESERRRRNDRDVRAFDQRHRPGPGRQRHVRGQRLRHDARVGQFARTKFDSVYGRDGPGERRADHAQRRSRKGRMCGRRALYVARGYHRLYLTANVHDYGSGGSNDRASRGRRFQYHRLAGRRSKRPNAHGERTRASVAYAGECEQHVHR